MRPQIGMLLVTTPTIEGKKIETLGLVKGNTIRARHIGTDLVASLKNIVGGELRGYTQMITEAREEATARMVDEARALGADAIVNVRFQSAEVMQGAAEILAYGTAVRFTQ